MAVCSRLGATDDERVGQLARSLSEWQWPDGGWNCDKDKRADHSSFYESLAPLWGLLEYHRATGDRDALETAKRASEFFLSHRLFRSDKTGERVTIGDRLADEDLVWRLWTGDATDRTR